MKIRKAEDTSKTDKKDLSVRRELPWMIDSFRDFETYADRFFRDVWMDFPELRGRLLVPRWSPKWAERQGAFPLKTPATDLKDRGKDFILRAEMPGVDRDGVDITIHRDSVEVKGESESGREEEHEGYYYREIGRSSYYRRIPLPEEVDAEKAEGKLENGVLHLTLPKLQQTGAKPHKVKIQ